MKVPTKIFLSLSLLASSPSFSAQNSQVKQVYVPSQSLNKQLELAKTGQYRALLEELGETIFKIEETKQSLKPEELTVSENYTNLLREQKHMVQILFHVTENGTHQEKVQKIHQLVQADAIPVLVASLRATMGDGETPCAKTRLNATRTIENIQTFADSSVLKANKKKITELKRSLGQTNGKPNQDYLIYPLKDDRMSRSQKLKRQKPSKQTLAPLKGAKCQAEGTVTVIEKTSKNHGSAIRGAKVSGGGEIRMRDYGIAFL